MAKKRTAADIEAAAGSLQGSKKPLKRYRDTLQDDEPAQQQQAKEDNFERVMLTLYADQKPFLDALALEFKRKRDRGREKEIINRNTIIRALIELLKEIQFSANDRVNTEDELKALLQQKLMR